MAGDAGWEGPSHDYPESSALPSLNVPWLPSSSLLPLLKDWHNAPGIAGRVMAPQGPYCLIREVCGGTEEQVWDMSVLGEAKGATATPAL